MLFKIVVSTSFILFTAGVATVNAPVGEDADPFAKYGIETLQWEFPTVDAGKVYVNGTVEEALVQLMENYPDTLPFKSMVTSTSASLEKRTDFSNANFNCGWGQYGKAYRIGIQSGIEYLRNLNGQPTNGPGPGNCGRVSCSYGNAIWWCNDDNSPKTLASFGSIADGAQYIVMKCSWGGKGLAYTNGQVFHWTNWNVIVRHDNC